MELPKEIQDKLARIGEIDLAISNLEGRMLEVIKDAPLGYGSQWWVLHSQKQQLYVERSTLKREIANMVVAWWQQQKQTTL